MIGVAAHPADREYVREFFELFKTPWEWFVPEKRYTAVVSADGQTESGNAPVVVVYSAAEHPADRRMGVATHTMSGPADVLWGDSILPVYEGVCAFQGQSGNGVLLTRAGVVDYRSGIDAPKLWRVGYDLFAEIGYLLQTGQPSAHSQTPTLDLHIALLRQLLLDSGVAFIEIPPRPQGREFACCLTHDVDFVGVRRHTFDRTLAGFIAPSVDRYLGRLAAQSQTFC